MDPDNQGEIIIVKRGGGHEDEHHGGVWKIAFADFMTAMMAFFLVMWLINASNEQTKKALASYFNPIKLMDTTTNPKGVENSKYGVTKESDSQAEDTTTVKSNKPGTADAKKVGAGQYNEKALFSDPFAVLAEIAGGPSSDKGQGAKDAAEKNTTGEGLGLNKGVSFQDPFDPNTWNVRKWKQLDPEAKISPEKRMFSEEKAQQGELALKEDDMKFPKLEEQEVKLEKETAERNEDEAASEEAEQLSQSIRDKIEQEIEKGNLSEIDLDVVANKDGAMIVLSDQSQNGMFDIGSAKPTKSLVVTMEKIGKIIAGHDGQVEISGHTDGRKYQSGDYDNWRLSSARAQMAYYMLVRGGMEERKVEKISGQADMKLKLPDDPFAPGNRRIEVFLKLP